MKETKKLEIHCILNIIDMQSLLIKSYLFRSRIPHIFSITCIAFTNNMNQVLNTSYIPIKTFKCKNSPFLKILKILRIQIDRSQEIRELFALINKLFQLHFKQLSMQCIHRYFIHKYFFINAD